MGGALWGLYVYVANEKNAEKTRQEQARAMEGGRVAQAERDNMTRRIEAQKPFLQIQLATYLKTATLIGQRGLEKFIGEACEGDPVAVEKILWRNAARFFELDDVVAAHAAAQPAPR